MVVMEGCLRGGRPPGWRLSSGPYGQHPTGRSSTNLVIGEHALTAITRAHDLGDLAAHRSQLGDLGVDAFEHRFEPPPLRRTRRVALIGGVQRVDHLVEGEAECL